MASTVASSESLYVRTPLAVLPSCDIPPPPEGITPEGEVYVAALLTNAFIYNPDVDDIKIASDKLQKYGRTEPREVITTIEEMLAISDEPVEQDLEALDAQ